MLGLPKRVCLFHTWLYVWSKIRSHWKNHILAWYLLFRACNYTALMCRLWTRVNAVIRWQDFLYRLRVVRNPTDDNPLQDSRWAAHDPHVAHVQRSARRVRPGIPRPLRSTDSRLHHLLPRRRRRLSHSVSHLHDDRDWLELPRRIILLLLIYDDDRIGQTHPRRAAAAAPPSAL